MKITLKSIGGGAYEERANGRPTGRFWERYWKTERDAAGQPVRVRTRRLLRQAKNRRQAIGMVSARNPNASNGKFVFLAETYITAGCPDKRCVPYNPLYLQEEVARARKLIEHFGEFEVDDLRGGDWHGYFLWRVGTVRTGQTGYRTVDKERQTMRNIFNYACATRKVNANPFAFGTAKYQEKSLVRHSTERAPKTADHIHAIAAQLFHTPETETTGWFVLFAMFTGCRISELLQLRTNARHLAPGRFEPGYIETVPGDTDTALPRQFLHVQRAKSGINPRCAIGPDFADMLAAFQNWHAARWPDCHWYFPGRTGKSAIIRRQVNREIIAACKAVGLPEVTPHGFRSYFVSKHRSDRVEDAVIASWLGDKTVSLMQDTYGKVPDSWTGGSVLSWLPRKTPPAWAAWKPNPTPSEPILPTQEAAAPTWREQTGCEVVSEWTPANPDNSSNLNRINDAGVAKWQTHRT